MNRAAILSLGCLLLPTGSTTGTHDDSTHRPPGPPATCALVATLTGCAAGAVSYCCAGDRPDDGDTNLVCDDGTPGYGDDGGGTTLFCCAPYGQWATGCTPAPHVAGCGARSLGFSCPAGATSPDEADTSIVCSQAIAGEGGTSDYCCVPFDQTTGVCRCSSFDVKSSSCGMHPSGCTGATLGFTCAAGHAPSEGNALLTCSAPDGGSDAVACCRTP